MTMRGRPQALLILAILAFVALLLLAVTLSLFAGR